MSETARRSNPSRIASPSSSWPIANSTLPSSEGTAEARSHTRATGTSSPASADLRRAEAATVSTAATANRTDTPERGSTLREPRASLVNRATASHRCPGTTVPPGTDASWRSTARSSSRVGG